LDANALLAAAAQDVVVLHEAFEAWLAGRAQRGAEGFAAIEAAFAPDFSMIPPDGALLTREAVVTRLAGAHGGYGSDFRIVIDELSPLFASAEIAAVRYVERQFKDGETRERWSTALIGPGQAKSGVAWRFVQETWKPS